MLDKILKVSKIFAWTSFGLASLGSIIAGIFGWKYAREAIDKMCDDET
jgi:hypothetical protein